ncbi:MerR family transcriptional regulator [Paracoccus sp. TK19116]|uniref:MerR family transcriptional regulator n=1 Tax=Paracoccus albicereus TaxID=2922394 RepID=A0ABT1MTD0_9RHOB|nr:MerR family transcriptional regulator [Paracoccus albicereus]MCQ0971577.1 MerR family transcriptional regulator [Paracoccus albicereus]
MEKGADAFRSIGEVAKLVGVAPHVLRYWETQFSQLNPMKRRDGRRYYRPDDVRLVAGLCEILREEGLTIRGARKMLSRDRGEAVRARGAARLGEALGAALQPEPSADQPQKTRQATRDHANGAAASSPTDTSRPTLSRKRMRSLSSHDEALPLFRDLGGTTPHVIDRHWLVHLVETAAALRAHADAGALPHLAVRPARDLRDALSSRD